MEITEKTLRKVYTIGRADLIAYTMAVGEKIGKDEALRIHAQLLASKADMLKENLSQLGITGNDARAGMAVIDAVVGGHYPGMFELMELQRTEDTPQRVITCYKGWCATLNACKMLELTPKDFCPISHEEGLTTLVQVVNPKLQVRLGKLRPEADCCEVIVEIKE
ncbi:MAG: hypothetical protein AAGB97_06855 [Dehalococcoidia bacterium]|nr:hypothetical protein [Chloroflexota bacterium]MBT9162055.1 hypothetical protein [Chloroflexota bacterium]